MLNAYFRNTITLKRSTVTGNKTTYVNVATAVPCHIQPVDDEFTISSMGRSAKTYRMFSQIEVRIGDRVTDEGPRNYEVYGAKKHTFRAKTHYEAMLRGV
jgi:hypothetical protein